ncbi:MAG TPA: UDP-glucose/GDP-mannose dehydrogenase family protein, partial [Ignavibacteria bacterium]|nr:UDP-glucose/GDP-mannose dehydrogenase family protein [Ignavibacteria bacterium]
DKNSTMTILQTVDEINNRQKLVLVNKILQHFNNDIKGKELGVWGLSFKPNTDDMREAPSIYIINELLKLGAKISAYDPEAIENSKFYFNEKIEYAENQYDAIKEKDALLILTEWNEFRNPDMKLVAENLKEKLVFDGRNVFTPDRMKELGFTYYSIGRVAVK